MEIALAITLTIITAATPLLFAAMGELVTERAGVLNLGVEGMMLTGAVAAFAGAHITGYTPAGILVGALAGLLMSLLFAVLTLHLLANQVASGLALTLFGVGLSALIGRSLVGVPIEPLPSLAVPFFSDLPLIGPWLFNFDLLIYLSLVSTGLVSWFLYRTRAGLVLRAVGENHHSAHVLGHRVRRVRYLAVGFGGMMAGLGGAYLSLALTPLWAENMTAGRGWIALALVVFATWKPWRVLIGAYLFGGVTILQLHAQALGIALPAQFLSMLPYLATITVLVLISADAKRLRSNAPASLGRVFHPDT